MVADIVQDPGIIEDILSRPLGWFLILLLFLNALLATCVNFFGSKTERTYAKALDRDHKSLSSDHRNMKVVVEGISRAIKLIHEIVKV